MQTAVKEKQWIDLTHKLGKEFAKRAVDYDREATFVEKNYSQLSFTFPDV
jgi:hypothetical protein